MQKKTCLYDRHKALGATMEPFAGYIMPIRYTSIKEEHEAVRNHVGVFDVSHMGEIRILGPQAAKYADFMFSNDILNLKENHIAYGFMLHATGTVVDDLLAYKISEHEVLFVVNAANIEKDYTHLVNHTDDFDVRIRNESEQTSQLAIQGPEAVDVLPDIIGGSIETLQPFTFKDVRYEGEMILVSRTGYTGEDGFEVYASRGTIRTLWETLLGKGVKPVGLGARDTLRFEASLPLYGNELTDEITPLEAGFSMFVKLDSDRDFLGREALEKQKKKGVERRIVGIELEKRAIPRHGYPVYKDDEKIGYVTTGYLSITLGKPIAMAMVEKPHTKKKTAVEVEIRGRMIPGFVRKRTFYKQKK